MTLAPGEAIKISFICGLLVKILICIYTYKMCVKNAPRFNQRQSHLLDLPLLLGPGATILRISVICGVLRFTVFSLNPSFP